MAAVPYKPIADATPYPLPAGSRLLQDLGFLAFTLPQVAILMPMNKPRGQELPLEEQRANQAFLSVGSGSSMSIVVSALSYRERPDPPMEQRVRDLVMELCCALHNFRARFIRGINGLIGINSIDDSACRGGYDPFRTASSTRWACVSDDHGFHRSP